jgi:hypothetical protein
MFGPAKSLTMVPVESQVTMPALSLVKLTPVKSTLELTKTNRPGPLF